MVCAELLQQLFENDPFVSLYNLDGFSTFAMTADIDWAPEYAIDDMLDLFSDAGITVSCFATHASPVLKSAGRSVEIGLHPDYTRPHPEHGLIRKLDELKELFPEATGVRSHRNFF